MTAAAPRPGAADQLPLSVLLPDDPGAPALIYDTTAALAMAVVDRGAVTELTGGWDAPGVYVLLDRHDSEGTWGCYVGKAPGGVRTRLGQHLRSRDHWCRALFIRRDTTFGFNSAHVGWLEGRLYDLHDAAADTRLHNGNRPSDETLPPYERAALESIVPPIRRVLRLLGYNTETPTTKLQPGRRRGPAATASTASPSSSSSTPACSPQGRPSPRPTASSPQPRLSDPTVRSSTTARRTRLPATRREPSGAVLTPTAGSSGPSSAPPVGSR